MGEVFQPLFRACHQHQIVPSLGELPGKFGAKACLLSWLPIAGDPLCAVAGWLRLPFWPCLFYMAIGKFIRYVGMTAFLVWVT